MESAIAWLRDLPAWGIYAFTALSCFIENVFPPWPGDTFNVFTGFLAANGVADIRYMFLAAMVGNMAAAYVKYYLGIYIIEWARGWEKKLESPLFLKKWLSQLTDPATLEKTHRWFDQWGFLFVTVSRFFAVIRFFVSIVAGMTRMNIVLYTISFAVGAAAWNGILFWGGYALGKNWETILHWLALYNRIVLGLLTAAAAIYGVYWWRKKKSETKA